VHAKVLNCQHISVGQIVKKSESIISL